MAWRKVSKSASTYFAIGIGTERNWYCDDNGNNGRPIRTWKILLGTWVWNTNIKPFGCDK